MPVQIPLSHRIGNTACTRPPTIDGAPVAKTHQMRHTRPNFVRPEGSPGALNDLYIEDPEQVWIARVGVELDPFATALHFGALEKRGGEFGVQLAAEVINTIGLWNVMMNRAA